GRPHALDQLVVVDADVRPSRENREAAQIVTIRQDDDRLAERVRVAELPEYVWVRDAQPLARDALRGQHAQERSALLDERADVHFQAEILEPPVGSQEIDLRIVRRAGRRLEW